MQTMYPHSHLLEGIGDGAVDELDEAFGWRAARNVTERYIPLLEGNSFRSMRRMGPWKLPGSVSSRSCTRHRIAPRSARSIASIDLLAPTVINCKPCRFDEVQCGEIFYPAAGGALHG